MGLTEFFRRFADWRFTRRIAAGRPPSFREFEAAGRRMERDVQRAIREHPYPGLSEGLLAKLGRIGPTPGDPPTWPCDAQTRDGQWVANVYFAEAGPWYRSWRIWPEDDRGKREVSVADVVAVRESPNRLPPSLLEGISESGMGYTLFDVYYADGTRSAHAAGNAIDFIDYPPGKTAADVVAVRQDGRRNDPDRRNAPDYVWCLFSGPSPTGPDNPC